MKGKGLQTNKEWLYQKFVVECLSVSEIARLANRSVGNVNLKIREFRLREKRIEIIKQIQSLKTADFPNTTPLANSNKNTDSQELT